MRNKTGQEHSFVIHLRWQVLSGRSIICGRMYQAAWNYLSVPGTGREIRRTGIGEKR